MMTPDEIDAVACAFFGGLESGSLERVNACCTPDARIWHNFDKIARNPAENAAGVELLFNRYPRRRYRSLRRAPIPGGFVEQFVLELERTDGVRIDWPGCIFFSVADGKITALEEYVDVATLAQAG